MENKAYVFTNSMRERKLYSIVPQIQYNTPAFHLQG